MFGEFEVDDRQANHICDILVEYNALPSVVKECTQHAVAVAAVGLIGYKRLLEMSRW